MPWDSSPNAGFTSGTPWLPLNPDWPSRNVAAQDADAGSMLNLYRGLLALRKTRAELGLGAIAMLDAPDGVLRYERSLDGRRSTILLNLTPQAVAVDWAGEVLLSTRDGMPEAGVLRPDEGLIVQ